MQKGFEIAAKFQGERDTHPRGGRYGERDNKARQNDGGGKERAAEETWQKHYMCKDVRTPLPSPGGLEAVAATTSSHGSYYSLDLF
jgi:hypothetical protein